MATASTTATTTNGPNEYTLECALQHVSDQQLVYDPNTKQLCLRSTSTSTSTTKPSSTIIDTKQSSSSSSSNHHHQYNDLVKEKVQDDNHKSDEQQVQQQQQQQQSTKVLVLTNQLSSSSSTSSSSLSVSSSASASAVSRKLSDSDSGYSGYISSSLVDTNNTLIDATTGYDHDDTEENVVDLNFDLTLDCDDDYDNRSIGGNGGGNHHHHYHYRRHRRHSSTSNQSKFFLSTILPSIFTKWTSTTTTTTTTTTTSTSTTTNAINTMGKDQNHNNHQTIPRKHSLCSKLSSTSSSPSTTATTNVPTTNSWSTLLIAPASLEKDTTTSTKDNVDDPPGSSSSSSSSSGPLPISLGNRPAHLPPKNALEQRRHQAEFAQIIQQAKRKEAKVYKAQQRQLAAQLAQEATVSDTIRQWITDILPHWSTSSGTKRTQELWWNGIPSAVRPKVWPLAIGNELNITEELYHICVCRSRERIWTRKFDKKSTTTPPYHHRRNCSTPVTMMNGEGDGGDTKQNHRRIASQPIDSTTWSTSTKDVNNIDEDDDDDDESIAYLIKLDVSRTFPQLGFFQDGGPYHQALSDILAAYAVYRPDLGYCQGMSFLAAILLLNLDSPVRAFVALANLLNNELLLSFYRLNQRQMFTTYRYYEQQLRRTLPRLAAHFHTIGLSVDLFFVDQIYTLFTRSLSLECASRVWDLILRDGNSFIFRASLALLAMYEDQLLQLVEFVQVAQFLSRLPDDMNVEKYFQYISNIKLYPPKFDNDNRLDGEDCDYINSNGGNSRNGAISSSSSSSLFPLSTSSSLVKKLFHF